MIDRNNKRLDDRVSVDEELGSIIEECRTHINDLPGTQGLITSIVSILERMKEQLAQNASQTERFNDAMGLGRILLDYAPLSDSPSGKRIIDALNRYRKLPD